MEIDRLTDRHARLQQDLADAYSATPWNAGEIDRLADALSSTEREITQMRSAGGSPGAHPKPWPTRTNSSIQGPR